MTCKASTSFCHQRRTYGGLPMSTSTGGKAVSKKSPASTPGRSVGSPYDWNVRRSPCTASGCESTPCSCIGRRCTEAPRASKRLALSRRKMPSPKPASSTCSVGARRAQRASRAAINGGVRTKPCAFSGFFIAERGSRLAALQCPIVARSTRVCKRKSMIVPAGLGRHPAWPPAAKARRPIACLTIVNILCYAAP
jgi:hypothetical protein